MAADPYAALARQTEPADPTEAEYQAFCDALMDDERGRWFLAEFTRRNRNADTGLLLKALDRIEALVQLGSPDVYARLQQELRAIRETIRASRAEAAADEIGETAKLLVLLAQIERRIDAMIGEPARAIAQPAEISDTPREPRSHFAIVPAATETAQPVEDTTASALMPPVAWTESLAAMPSAAAAENVAMAEPAADATLPDIQPAPPVNENEPQATYVTEPVAPQAAQTIAQEQPAPEQVITDDEVARAIAEWTAASTANAESVAEILPAHPVESTPTPMAFGDTESTALDSAAEGFALPAAGVTDPVPQEWTPPAVAETAPVEAQEPATTQALVLEQFEPVVETQIEQPQAPLPESPRVLPAASERTFAPYEFEALVQPAPEAAEIGSAQAMLAETSTAETSTADTTEIETSVLETNTLEAAPAVPGAIETAAAEPVASTPTETAIKTAAASPAPALETLELRMAAANALAALAGLSEEERIALFT